MPTYSTSEVATRCGVHKRTLLDWLYAGRLPEPRRVSAGGQDVRVWSEHDLRRAVEFARLHYRKATVPGRGRKRKKPAKKLAIEQTPMFEPATRSTRKEPLFAGIADEPEKPWKKKQQK